jgi:molybdopterin-guanine dinucleotide biosynthesis protein A
MPDATLAILAGGRGSRMGGTKDRLTVAGRPILLHLLDRLAFDGPTLLVTSPRHPTPVAWERFDRVVFDDPAGDGPLAGVAAAVAAANTPFTCVLSVDMPGVGPGQLQWLIDSLRARPTVAGLLGRRPHSGGAFSVEPFPSGFRSRPAAEAVTAHFEAGGRSMRSLLDLPAFDSSVTPVDWDDTVWANLNEPQDLIRLDVKMG